jgi:hypothetical protein
MNYEGGYIIANGVHIFIFNRLQIIIFNLTPEQAYDHCLDTEKGFEAWKERTANMYYRFLKLPNRYPVHFVENQEDAICRTCAVGSHCMDKKMEGRDTKSFDVFLEEARRRLPHEEITVRNNDVLYSNGERGTGRRAITTVGVIRKILMDRKDVYPYWIT